MGVLADADRVGRITGLTIEGNYIHDGYVGIIFLGINDSNVLNNIIRDNAWRGISMESNMDCLFKTGPECFYSTGNTLTGNEVLGQFLDL